jgi:hypothetical protein
MHQTERCIPLYKGALEKTMAISFLTGFEVGPETVVWRCMPRTRFLEMCDERAAYFASAKEFSDPWEGALSAQSTSLTSLEGVDHDLLKAYWEPAFEDLGRLTKIQCWQMASEGTRAMWSRYARTLDSVAIRSTVRRLMSALVHRRRDALQHAAV